MQQADCVVANIGPGPMDAGTTVAVERGYSCPLEVSRDNWLGDSNFGDTFYVQQVCNFWRRRFP
eukprot:SAG31_NODE_6510_length_1991_cov_2.016385_3_plen_64_part_00